MKKQLIILVPLLAACQVNPELVGEAEATITQVPPQVACIQLVAAGSRTQVQSIDVVTGQSTVVNLSNIPIGQVTFSASAFAVGCNSAAGALANWQSDPVVANVAPGAVTPVALAMHQTGGASVGIDFNGDAGAPPLPTDGGTGDMGMQQQLSPSPLDFGSASRLLGNSVTRPMFFQNLSGSPLTVTSVSINGIYGMDFKVESHNCFAAPLAPNATCTLQLNFKPTSTGNRMGQVSVGSALGTAVATLLGVGTT